MLGALGLGVLLMIAVLFAMLSGDPEPPASNVPQQALEEGERALHQGKWIDALEAFDRLGRFPGSDEAHAVRDRGLQERAFNAIMDADPSPKAVRRLERLAELYPDRPDVRTRLGEVRKALSSGTRVAPPDSPSAE